MPLSTPGPFRDPPRARPCGAAGPVPHHSPGVVRSGPAPGSQRPASRSAARLAPQPVSQPVLQPAPRPVPRPAHRRMPGLPGRVRWRWLGLGTLLVALAAVTAASVRSCAPGPLRAPGSSAAVTPARLLDAQEALDRADDDLAQQLEAVLPPAEAARLRSLRIVFADSAWLRAEPAQPIRDCAPAALRAAWDELARRVAELDDALARVSVE